MSDQKPSLVELFDCPNAKLLDFLLENKESDYSIEEMIKLVPIPNRTLQKSIHLLLNEYVIKRYKKNGPKFYYTINLESPRVDSLLCYINDTN